MTISYSDRFWKLLIRWKGSLWKSCYIELIIFLIAYALLSVTYRLWLNPSQRNTFEQTVIEVNGYTKSTPITWVLGFYVTSVVGRWWQQFENLSWPDEITALIRFIFPDSKGKNSLPIRLAVVRYTLLSIVLCWRDISKPVMLRFPTVKHLVHSGLMTVEELEMYEKTSIESKWFLPIDWAQNVVTSQPKMDPSLMYRYIEELRAHRDKLLKLYCYDWVATLVTYTFLLMCIIGRQYITPANNLNPEYACDLYFPIFTVMQVVFYVGWFKVGKYIMSPFGDDDDDLELNYLLDRHFQVAFAMAGPIAAQIPTVSPVNLSMSNGFLPHTKRSWKLWDTQHPPKSMVKCKNNLSDQELVLELDVMELHKANQKVNKSRPF